MNSKTNRRIRKMHRYLGVILGVQFLMWTISGLYFSWSDLDQIHGDYFKKDEPKQTVFTGLIGLDSLTVEGVRSIELREIGNHPFYWINEEQLFEAKTGELRTKGITKEEAVLVANAYMVESLDMKKVELIDEVDDHHEYRGRKLPAYAISYDHPHEVVAYVSKEDGLFQRVRHRNWRWFDFLWMTHTMDYQTRDNFNTLALRAFSLFGLITVLSGFLLFFISMRIGLNP